MSVALTIRSQFPLLSRTVHGGKPLTYLDNAATVQKPEVVLRAMDEYYRMHNSNVHRGAHAIAAEATTIYEGARARVATFLGAEHPEEIIFTKGTTEAVNLVAAAWGGANVREADEILVTEMEHHANIVPWQLLAQKTGAVVKAVPVESDGTLDLDVVASLITDRTRMLAFTHVSNTLGTVNAARELCTLARERGVLTFVDGAQAVPHRRVDVQHIGCDFYAFSAHKLYGPTGTGVLYGRLELLESMPPYQGGGSMIERVSFDGTTFNGVPMRFEAGTPNIAGAAGLHAAIDWFCALDLAEVEAEEQRLLQQMLAGVNAIPGAHVLGSAADRVGIVSFVIDGIHAHDLGVLLDEQGVAIRTGHHCTMPLLERFGYSTVARASLAAYSTAAEVDAFLAATHKAIGVLV